MDNIVELDAFRKREAPPPESTESADGTGALLVIESDSPGESSLPALEVIEQSALGGMMLLLGFFGLIELARYIDVLPALVHQFDEWWSVPLSLIAAVAATLWGGIVVKVWTWPRAGYQLLIDYIGYRRYVRHQKAAGSVPPAIAGLSMTEMRKPPQAKPATAPGTLPPDVEKVFKALTRALMDAEVVAMMKKPIIGPSAFYLPVDPCGNTTGLQKVKADVTRVLPAGSRYADPLPGNRYPGWIVPNARREGVDYAELITRVKPKAPALTVVLGKSQQGKMVTTNIAEHPHLIVAGVTNSGKSIASYLLLLSILDRTDPDHVRLVIIDQKTTEYAPFFYDIAHLAAPIVTESAQALPLACQLVDEMKERQRILAQHRVRDIDGYHRKGGKMPRIVIVIDELRDLLMELDKSDSEELVNGLTRIAQRARNAGMHLVIMTQRPDSAAVPGPLKSQMPARLLLRMGYTDAQTLMTSPPVEVDRLQGKGDSILIDNHHPAGIRVQCAFVDDQNPADRSELEQRLDDIRNTHGQPRYLFELETLDPIEPEPEAPALASDDPRYPDAVLLVVETQSPSKATVKRAGVTNDTEQTRMLQAMDKDGFTGKPSGNKRVVLMTPAEARAKLGF